MGMKCLSLGVNVIDFVGEKESPKTVIQAARIAIDKYERNLTSDEAISLRRQGVFVPEKEIWFAFGDDRFMLFHLGVSTRKRLGYDALSGQNNIQLSARRIFVPRDLPWHEGCKFLIYYQLPH